MALVDELQKKLVEVRRSRRLAQKSESFTAVATLHRLEVDLSHQIAELSSAAAPADPWADMTADQIAEQIADLCRTMTPAHQALVRAAVTPGLRVAR